MASSTKVGKRVAVIGGGNVAVDAARSALRLGARKVSIIYRRSEDEMPAFPWDIEEARDEGITFEFLAAPVGVTREKGNVTGVECRRMELGRPDESGRRRPLPVEGSNFVVPADMVIAAIGQTSDLSFLAKAPGLASHSGKTIDADKLTMATARPGVFAGGDSVIGPASVVEAVAHGQKAAISIEKYLSGHSLIEQKLALGELRRVDRLPDAEIEAVQDCGRQAVDHLPADERKQSFAEVVQVYDEERALVEAKRCLRCDLE